MTKLEIIQWTEAQLNEAGERLNARTKATVGLWLDLADIHPQSPPEIRLVPVLAEQDWEKMRAIRGQIEDLSENGASPDVAEMIFQIQRCQTRLRGQWYLACEVPSHRLVGEVGLVQFARERKIARLQDVDIIPSHQGRGLGNQLLQAIIAHAKAQKISALCLKADRDDWPLNWYRRNGFQAVGEWLS